MRRLLVHLIVDGERDRWMLPGLLERTLGCEVEASDDAVEHWKNIRLNRKRGRGSSSGKGYGPKLQYAIRRTQSRGLSGLVAMLDRDKAQTSRLRQLMDARQLEQERGCALPIAIGEANPNGEAWLLDDHTAVQSTLRLGAEAKIPAVGSDPKTALQRLIEASPRRGEAMATLFTDLGQAVSVKRSRTPRKTGLQAFCADVRRELATG